MVAITEMLDRWLDPVGRASNPEAAAQLLRITADEQTQERVAYLADRCTEGLLTSDERAEYEAFVAVADLIAILQTKARRRMTSELTAG